MFSLDKVLLISKSDYLGDVKANILLVLDLKFRSNKSKVKVIPT